MKPTARSSCPTRRQFLHWSGVAAVGIDPTLVGLLARFAGSSTTANPDRPPRGRKSVVVNAVSDIVAEAPQIRVKVMSEMFENAVRMLAGTRSTAEAWKQFLDPSDVVGIAFTAHGQRTLGTAEPFADCLLRSLTSAGWPGEQIVLYEAPGDVGDRYHTRPFEFGWTAEVLDFGSGRDRLSSFVDQVTAIINVPFLKDDNILGLSGCLKNVTYHLLQHPARYHGGGGAPYLADVYALPQISGKLRLNIMNALRCVYDKGPLVDRRYVENTGMLLLGRDAVAVDALALEELTTVRSRHGLPPLEAPSLPAAADRGLGHIDFRRIERLTATAG